MARKIKVTAGVLNIRLHPHSPEVYADWIKSIYRRKNIAQVYGDRYGMISMLDTGEQDNGRVHGIITTFVRIEDDGSWFNTDKMEIATEDQKSQIVIPDGLYPNSASFYFTFDTIQHKFYFQTYSKGKSLNPNPARRLMEGLSCDLEILKHFKEASINIMQEHTSLQKMFGMKVIKRVEVTILRPNTDVFDDDFEKKIEGHLNRTKSQKMTVTYQAQHDQSIVPDDDLNTLTNAGLTNGSVTVSGRDERGSVTLNSEAYPVIYHDQFDPDELSERNAFRAILPQRLREK